MPTPTSYLLPGSVPNGDEAKNLKKHLCACLSSIGRRVVLRRNLYHVAADDVQACETTNYRLSLAHGQSANLWRASPRCEGGIKAIHIEGKIEAACSDNVAGAVDDGGDTQAVDLLSMNHGHTGFVRELPMIFGRSTNPNLNRSLRIEHAFQNSMPKGTAMMEFASIIRPSGIAVGVDMHKSYRSVPPENSQYWERDRMIATHAHGNRPAAHDRLNRGFDVLMASEEIVPATERHIADIRYPQFSQGCRAQCVIVRADAFDGSQRAWTETRASAVADAKIHRSPEKGNVQAVKRQRAPINGSMRRIEQRRNARIGDLPSTIRTDDGAGYAREVGIVERRVVAAAEPTT
jgi:uncharacterized protein YecT (DUF1311 family)